MYKIAPCTFAPAFPSSAPPTWSDVPGPAHRTAPAQVVDAALHDQRITVVGIPHITIHHPPYASCIVYLCISTNKTGSFMWDMLVNECHTWSIWAVAMM